MTDYATDHEHLTFLNTSDTMNNEATDKNIQLETIPLQPEGEVGVGKNEVANMSAEDRATALRIAMDADPGIPEWSWRMLKFNLMAVLVMLCGNDSGQ